MAGKFPLPNAAIDMNKLIEADATEKSHAECIAHAVIAPVEEKAPPAAKAEKTVPAAKAAEVPSSKTTEQPAA